MRLIVKGRQKSTLASYTVPVILTLKSDICEPGALMTKHAVLQIRTKSDPLRLTHTLSGSATLK